MIAQHITRNATARLSTESPLAATLLPAHPPCLCPRARTLWRVFHCAEEVESHGFVLTPGRYVGAVDVEDDGEPFEDKMERLSATLQEQFAESNRLQEEIKQNLAMVASED